MTVVVAGASDFKRIKCHGVAQNATKRRAVSAAEEPFVRHGEFPQPCDAVGSLRKCRLNLSSSGFLFLGRDGLVV